MDSIKIAVCDDDKTALDIVSGSVSELFHQKGKAAVIKSFASGFALREELKNQKYDLCFLDIDMPGLDGISIAKELQKQNASTCVVFVSNCEDRVFDALTVFPFGFVRKSNFLKDIALVVNAYLKSEEKDSEGQRILVREGQECLSLKPSEVLYIEGSGRTTTFHLKGNPKGIPTHLLMKDLEKELAPEGFLRVHKGFIVNSFAIERIERTQIVLSEGSLIPISRRRCHEIKQRYLSIMQNAGANAL